MKKTWLCIFSLTLILVPSLCSAKKGNKKNLWEDPQQSKSRNVRILDKPAKIFIALEEEKDRLPEIPHDLKVLQEAYRNLDIKAEFSKEKNDWLMTFSNYGRDYAFWWCDGRVLPEEEIENRANYWSLVYSYNRRLKDPSDMTEEERQRLKEFGSISSRKSTAGTPMFFFDALYDSYSQAKIEQHIKVTTFLGKRTKVHERIYSPLKKVEEQIYELAKTDDEVNSFVLKIKSCDAYHWRLIDGTSRKSFHSLGIAMDILPVRITGEIFWSWARDKNPEGWMLTPLSRRWMPPKKVIEIFESEGFIWGGNWIIWDNMHFEYHPELLAGK